MRNYIKRCAVYHKIESCRWCRQETPNASRRATITKLTYSYKQKRRCPRSHRRYTQREREYNSLARCTHYTYTYRCPGVAASRHREQRSNNSRVTRRASAHLYSRSSAAATFAILLTYSLTHTHTHTYYPHTHSSPRAASAFAISTPPRAILKPLRDCDLPFGGAAAAGSIVVWCGDI